MFIGLVLLTIGLIALLVKLGVLTGSIWSYTWPAILIILGLLLISRPHFRRHHIWRWCWPPREDKGNR